MGITFKENCIDTRNSKVFDIINGIRAHGIDLLIHDPIADEKQTFKNHQITLRHFSEIKNVQALIIAVSHRFYKELTLQELSEKITPGGIIIDVKGILDKNEAKKIGIHVWSL
jgi:UDP-N-acetyl-D-galactosamine dehydrogenase